MSEQDKKLLNTICMIAALIFMVPVVLFHAWTAVTLWGWFITPIFGIAAPGLIAVLGLRIAVHFLLPHGPDVVGDAVAKIWQKGCGTVEDPPAGASALGRQFFEVVYSLIALLFGAIYLFFL